MSSEKILNYIGEQLKALTAIASPTGFTKQAAQWGMNLVFRIREM